MFPSGLSSEQWTWIASMSWQQVQDFKYWDCPRTLGLCQKPQDPGTLRSLTKKNIILEQVETLGLWESPSVPGLSQDLWTLPKTSRSRDSEVLDEKKYKPRKFRDSGFLGISQCPQNLGTLPKTSRSQDSEAIDVELNV